MFIGIDKARYSVSTTVVKSITNVSLILLLIFSSVRIALIKVVAIDSLSLIIAVIFIKIIFYRFIKANKVTYKLAWSDFRLSNIIK